MKNLTKEEQIKFYQEEIIKIISEFRGYLDSKCIQLFNKNELYVGTFEYIDKIRNQVVISFPKEKLPKTKILLTASKPKSLSIIQAGFEDYTYSYYRKNCVASFSECIGVYYQEVGNIVNVGFSNFDIEFANTLVKGSKIVFGLTDPPTKYYYNLIQVTKNEAKSSSVDNVVLGNYHLDDFNPLKIDDSNLLIDKFKNELKNQETVIIQGPPGTGKTYFISKLLKEFSREKKSVLVATLANRSLIELSKQYFEEDFNESVNVYKSNLTLEESGIVRELRPMSKNYLPSTGDVLLTTFYQMSGLATENISNPIYDYVILEEASQCLLGTIAAAKLIGGKVILVGDPQQLPPIINQENSVGISHNIDLMEKAFSYYASTVKCSKFMLTTTYRFSKSACDQTNVFYKNSLNSKSKIQVGNSVFSDLPSIYNKEGGSSLYYYDSQSPKVLYDFLFTQINLLIRINPEFEFAILSSTKAGVKLLRDNLLFQFNQDQDQVLINTVDSVQGLTVDFCFYFAYSDKKPTFSFNENRFNVATSRARYCSVILMDELFKVTKPFKGVVAEFISKCLFEMNNLENENHKIDVIESGSDSASKLPGLKIIDKIDLSQFEKPQKEIVLGKENIYVIDTNVFVDCPDVISKIDKKHSIVLSAKVIDELDFLKISLGEEQKRNVQKALRLINESLDTRGVKMHTENLSLLPNDFNKKSPDNSILSVALKFKSENPIMLTSDNGLQIKAKGLGVTTISLRDFLKQKKY
ncbi:hypothetical protein EWU23_09260 [Cytophagaceae bacterium 50C-KIRBA]|uniref:PIN domain-containing protein n=1 Tax=Aquirufa beregesia TaxID=2516556 RepID=A0ABX0EVS1_9BACT|nr:PIN domain-containing protein [Aquirufa beregesia]NGZ44665.1 hypothetical protein [Aquirufa beregesia]